MNIEDVFPQDPFQPTVKYAAVFQAPFTVPWAKGRVRLGAGFNTQRGHSDPLFMKRSAFADVLAIPLQYRECQSTSIKDESGTDVATSSETTSFAISASVGGDFLGASGRGSYEKSVRDNRNTSNITVRAEHVCGQISAVRVPKLETNAIGLLMSSSDPFTEFRETYGDFYVAGYRLGAVNNTTISGDLANKSFFEGKKAELTIKVLLLKKKVSINEVSQSASDIGELRVCAFDSLTGLYTNFAARTVDDSLRAGQVATENKQKAMTIANRASQILNSEFSLVNEGITYQAVVDRLCDRGLVIELLLAPFSSLREYQSILSLRSNRRQR